MLYDLQKKCFQSTFEGLDIAGLAEEEDNYLTQCK